MRIHKNASRGAGLLELLMAMTIFMAILPFAYQFLTDRAEKAENAAIISKIKIVQSGLEQYISANRQKLLEPVSSNVIRLKLSDLPDIPKNIASDKFQIRVVKSKDSGGRAFVQGVVIYDAPDMTPFRTRQIATAGGESAGFADGRMLYGAFGTWQTSANAIGAIAGDNSILAQTRAISGGGDYLQRLPSDNPLDATMNADLFMGGQDITGIQSLTAGSVKIYDSLTAESIETSRMTILNRQAWSAPLDIFGSAMVMGNLSSDGKNLTAGTIAITGSSQFRSVSADSLSVKNLILAGFSVAANNGQPALLKISGGLDMTKGHIKATDAFVGFSGSVAPKLIVATLIEDSSNPNFYWNADVGIANFYDLQLSGLPPIIRAAWTAEKTGKTETERLLGNAVLNSNATAADYLGLLEQVKNAVERKYNQLNLGF